jgi:cell wall-associated NlpC family hydrolase
MKYIENGLNRKTNAAGAVFPLLVFVVLLFAACGAEKPPLLPGDILFQDFTSPQSRAIKLATDSKYSHVGIYFEQNGKQLVVEAVSPVKLTFLEAWIGRNPDSAYAVRRLKDRDDLLTDSVVADLWHTSLSFLNTPYDLYFSWDDDRLYCSEFVWKVYKSVLGIELTQLRPLSDYDLDQPEVAEKLKTRFGDHVPLDELVVAPSDLYNTDKLETIRP